MITVAEAQEAIWQAIQSRSPTCVDLGEALGRILSQDVASDIDSPPHDKSLVDGYAVIAADLDGGSAQLAMLEEVTAGQVPRHRVVSGKTTRIMTGAPLPAGADAVVMIEDTHVESDVDSHIAFQTSARPGQHIMRRGASIRRGQKVLHSGRRIRPIEIGLLAEAGVSQVPVYAQPSVAVLATGNELTPSDTVPTAGQIRNSNGPMMQALVHRAGGRTVDLGIARDDPEDLSRRIDAGLDCDVLVLSGGVSAGVLDLVPRILAERGVRQVFHKVRLKPGKPLWFGISPRNDGDTLVFGLPGNPVSTLVCFELFVRPAVARIGGCTHDEERLQSGQLASELRHRSDRPTYFPARCSLADGTWLIEPLNWQGSADLATLAQADCLLQLPAGDHTFAAGEAVRVFML
jgi:molybdopterin molybdotransferase